MDTNFSGYAKIPQNSLKLIHTKVNLVTVINHAVFGKTMENVKKHRDIKLLTTEATRHFVVSEPNYHTKKNFSENVSAMEMKKHKYS